MLTKITTSPIRTKRFLKRQKNALNRIAIPNPLKHHIPKPKHQKILHHLLPEVVINPEQLIFLKLLGESRENLLAALQIPPKRFFHNDARPSVLRHARFLDGNSRFFKDVGGDGKVKQSIALRHCLDHLGFLGGDLLIEFLIGFFFPVGISLFVKAEGEEFGNGAGAASGFCEEGSELGSQFFVCHFGSSVAPNDGVLG